MELTVNEYSCSTYVNRKKKEVGQYIPTKQWTMTLKEQCKTLCEIIVVLFFNLLNFWTPKDDSF